jgi:predicted transcriptional regulator
MAQEKRRHALTRPYANARDVLPPDLLEAVREHFTGLLWVPSDSGFYEERRRLVLALKEQGISTNEVARLAGITPRRVRQIVAGNGNSSSNGSQTA